ncbi:MAG: hypothetical protein ACXWCH_31830, partial [Burkholderiales bacterium]
LPGADRAEDQCTRAAYPPLDRPGVVSRVKLLVEQRIRNSVAAISASYDRSSTILFRLINFALTSIPYRPIPSFAA